jgi:hypothetical protein
MSTTLAQLEQKLNIMQIVRDNPWPAIALAVGAGVLLSGSRTDVKAAAATVAATRGASSRVGTVLDDVVAGLVGGLHEAFETRINSMVNDLKNSIGVPAQKQPVSAPMAGPTDDGRAAAYPPTQRGSTSTGSDGYAGLGDTAPATNADVSAPLRGARAD